MLCGGKRVALGTVVADGLVVTKASELAGKVACRFAGRDSDAAVVQTNDANDLALLSVPLVGATPVRWAAGEPDLARLLVAPRAAGTPAAFGVVGHAARRVPTLDAATREGLLSPLEQAEARRRAEKLAVLNPVFAADPSRRRDGFARAFSHDLPRAADESGGPLFDLAGRAVGVNVAREGVAGNLAVPGRVVANLVAGWQVKPAKP